MTWQKALFGYRESEVWEYLRRLAGEQAALCGELAAGIALAEEKKREASVALAALEDLAAARQKQLAALEGRLISGYYGAARLLCKARAGRGRRGLRKGGAGAGPGVGSGAGPSAGAGFGAAARSEEATHNTEWRRGIDGTMGEKHYFSTSLLGLSPKAVERRAAAQEMEHRQALLGLRERLDQLERALLRQEEEKKVLDQLLERPEMRPEFLDLAERFLSRFESALRDAVKQLGAAPTPRGVDERRDRALRQQIVRCGSHLRKLLRNLEGREKTAVQAKPAIDAARQDERAAQAEPAGDAARQDERAAQAEPAGDAARQAERLLRYGYLLGRRAGEALADARGEIIIQKGQSIGLTATEKAQAAGLLDQLVACSSRY
jgi:hypothetical protein